MEYAKLETAALAHVDDSYFYGAYCRSNFLRRTLLRDILVEIYDREY